MNRLLSPKMVWSSMTAVSIALLSGCSNLQSATAPANASEFTNVGAAAPLALPDAARLRISATEALSGQGMYYFDDDKAARLYIAQDKSSKDRFLVKESFDQGKVRHQPFLGHGCSGLGLRWRCGEARKHPFGYAQPRWLFEHYLWRPPEHEDQHEARSF